jgi:hypothetical protein
VVSALAKADHFAHSGPGVGNIRQTIPEGKRSIRGSGDQMLGYPHQVYARYSMTTKTKVG